MTPAVPADIDDEARRAIESETVDRMLHLLYFSQVLASTALCTSLFQSCCTCTTIITKLPLAVQTFDFDKPGELTMLERHACESYFNQQQPDKVSHALVMHFYCNPASSTQQPQADCSLCMSRCPCASMTSRIFASLAASWSADPQMNASVMERLCSRLMTWQCNGCILQMHLWMPCPTSAVRCLPSNSTIASRHTVCPSKAVLWTFSHP